VIVGVFRQLFFAWCGGGLYPELITEFKKRPQHELPLHGWIHESLVALDDPDEEDRLLRKARDFWTQAIGITPVGARAPGWAFSRHTLALFEKLDSSTTVA
jgi:peptidoglycan/xylan/chitin deacetylase (PgdA/CDA1 family)